MLITRGDVTSSTRAKVIRTEEVTCIKALLQIIKGMPTLLEPAVAKFVVEREGAKGGGDDGPVWKKRRVE